MILVPQKHDRKTTVKLYGCGEDKDKRIKVVRSVIGTPRTSYVDDNMDSDEKDDTKRNQAKSNTIASDEEILEHNNAKLDASISRSRSRIFELVFCNPWEWFFTATLDSKKFNRSDLAVFHKCFVVFVRNYNSKYKTKIKFLMIPERHADGISWHMHGFLHGVPVEHLHRFQLGDAMGKHLASKVKQGFEIYNWPAYQERFGFCDLEPIRNKEAVSKYVTKYVTKDLARNVQDKNAHMYYRSRGLSRATVIAEGTLPPGILPPPDYHDTYIAIWWLGYTPELEALLRNSVK